MDHNVMQQVSEVVDSMKNGVIRNYIVPGLDSFLLSRNDCKVRLFEMTREQEMFITPHSHRFDFACCVLKGSVTHYVYEQAGDSESIYPEIPLPLNGFMIHQINEYVASEKVPGPGSNTGFKIIPLGYGHFTRKKTFYPSGSWYTLTIEKFHSIEFTMGAQVLFLEGAEQGSTSYFLEPVVNGKVISLFSIPEWMYQP